MDKTILKDFAIYSRNKLIQDIKNKASMIGITEKGIGNPLSESTSDMLVFDIKSIDTYKIYGDEVKQYIELKKELEKRKNNSDYKTAYNTLVEEVAYTWFNRLIAIRFMEINNYLPNKLRVLSSGRDGVDEPEFLTHYEDTSLDLTKVELDLILNWKLDGSAPSMEKIFNLLFIKQCNDLNKNLPELFEEIDDYAELLLNISYIDVEGVLYKLIHDIPESYFDIESETGSGQVEIIGWMYQYYNTEKKDEVINIYKGIVKKEDIPAATQLFTTDWVVRYMVDNSLGKYWLERNPESSIKDSLEYLMPGEIPVIDEKISPEDLKIFDNAMGSGHCLSYAFDVLMIIYESEGYTSREAAKLIVENNIYGLDIDKRAYQLAYFAIMMKARQYNRRALNGEMKTNLGVFEDSININKNHLEYLGLSLDKEKRLKAIEQLEYLITEFENATEIGSILVLDDIDKKLISEYINDSATKGQVIMGEVNIDKTQEQLSRLVQIASIITNKYEIVVTNPPYLNKFSPKLKKYIWDNYNDYKGDMFSVFIYHNLELCKPGGYSAYMTPFVWMFIKTYEELRKYIIKDKHISSLIQMEYSAFEEATVPICTFVLQNNITKEKGNYIRLSDFTGGMAVQKTKTLEAISNPKCGYYYEIEQDNFEKIPGMPIAYWTTENTMNIFKYKTKIDNLSETRIGMATANNDLFMRLWHEIDLNKFSIESNGSELAMKSGCKWFPYSKGGFFRKWAGNMEYVVNWENDGYEIRNFRDERTGRLRSHNYNLQYIFKPGLTFSAISSSKFACRYMEFSLFGSGGSGICNISNDSKLEILAYLNSNVSEHLISILSSTMNFEVNTVGKLPFIRNLNNNVKSLAQKCISISHTDWGSFETSWDFKISPLVDSNLYIKNYYNNLQETKITTERKSTFISNVEDAYEQYKNFTNQQFNQLKINEEELNRIFIEIYGLEDELTPEVSDKDITIAKIFDNKEEIYDDIKGNRYILTKEDVIKSFISYAVGCIFGRYSLDIEGLAYAGGQWDDTKYTSFIPSKNNIILITDEEYFEDDIVNRFINFVRVVYGEETLEENLKFIADALGGKGSSKDIIRNYFVKDFFDDHVRRYQKRPIYWLYESGAGKTKRNQENGFKALIYMHRYDEDTTGRVRIEYLHKLQKSYERTIDNLRYDIANNKNPREVTQAEKRLIKLTKQLKECKDYDEKIAHLALARIPIDLDDGVKVNYEKVQTDEKGENIEILGKI